MANISAWGGGEGQPDAIAALIPLKPSTTSTITRGSGTVSAKVGRLETMAGSKQVQDSAGLTYAADAMLLCEYGTGFLPGDRFTISSQAFEVIGVLPGHTDCEQVMLKMRR